MTQEVDRERGKSRVFGFRSCKHKSQTKNNRHDSSLHYNLSVLPK
jgi:hypothetical protein